MESITEIGSSMPGAGFAADTSTQRSCSFSSAGRHTDICARAARKSRLGGSYGLNSPICRAAPANSTGSDIRIVASDHTVLAIPYELKSSLRSYAAFTTAVKSTTSVRPMVAKPQAVLASP
eukprot:gnl/TRDRNA2_/TRDRNA2_169160_c4_seq4.p2 gnl/TRDRNA2_/TRDRNA2_169160_c4~~gnl/TRDRNA2_/TRDRNA2_169160_c4_seq4.p2  ORF type:complete len:121 (-),score=1.90 gnl/TRDRNA2_/TRDRNA2_169160_c4_seq4:653-1015(-)